LADYLWRRIRRALLRTEPRLGSQVTAFARQDVPDAAREATQTPFGDFSPSRNEPSHETSNTDMTLDLIPKVLVFDAGAEA
jgi:hypothetical protein